MVETAIYTQEELRAIQRTELEILKEVHKVTEMLGVKYFLESGTLLGAIRHGGFIPWDDDIDIGMFRSDYEKFEEYAPVLLEEKGLFLQTCKTDRHSAYPYMKIRKNGTEFIEYCNRNSKQHQGIYIDIFPYDVVSPNPLKEKMRVFFVEIFIKLHAYHQIPDITAEPVTFNLKLKFVARRVIHYLAGLLPICFINFVLYKLFTIFKNTKNTIYKSLPDSLTLEFSDSVFYPLKKIKFCDFDFFVPNDEKKYLSRWYGDYMILPPESERKGHKPYKISLGNFSDL